MNGSTTGEFHPKCKVMTSTDLHRVHTGGRQKIPRWSVVNIACMFCSAVIDLAASRASWYGSMRVCVGVSALPPPQSVSSKSPMQKIQWCSPHQVSSMSLSSIALAAVFQSVFRERVTCSISDLNIRCVSLPTHQLPPKWSGWGCCTLLRTARYKQQWGDLPVSHAPSPDVPLTIRITPDCSLVILIHPHVINTEVVGEGHVGEVDVLEVVRLLSALAWVSVRISSRHPS